MYGLSLAAKVLAVWVVAFPAAVPMPVSHQLLGCVVGRSGLEVMYQAEWPQSTVTQEWRLVPPGETAPSGFTPACAVPIGEYGSVLYRK